MTSTASQTKPTLVERLRTHGVETILRNNFRHTTSLAEIERGIRLIDRHEKKIGVPVAILGQIWQTVARFETHYRVYELNKAKELENREPYGRSITRDYLEERKKRYLVATRMVEAPA